MDFKASGAHLCSNLLFAETEGKVISAAPEAGPELLCKAVGDVGLLASITKAVLLGGKI